VHVELTTSDTDKAKSFYGALFGWKLEDVEMAPGFTYDDPRWRRHRRRHAEDSAPGVPTAWLPYGAAIGLW
jgi:uncharacterized protein